jgi:hypothetical protein
MWSAMAQPTTRRLHRSITAARYSHPWSVGTYVMSAAHLASGRSAAKSRSRRLSATGSAWAESVVRTRNRPTTFERIPRSRITLATVFAHALTPPALSAAATRGLP